MQKSGERHDQALKRSPKNKQEVILVIDDSSDMRLLQRTVLEMEGFKVFTAASGAEALEILAQIGPPDLILLDVQMEDMSGPDFLNVLEKTFPELLDEIPIVFLTGMDEVPESKTIGFIRKPMVDMDNFLESIHRFIQIGTHRTSNRH